ncbi:MAG: TonB-dependent receptor [Chitinophagales bacterium]|nr:TonB-dependent receptor [Chitinophagales bacterium]
MKKILLNTVFSILAIGLFAANGTIKGNIFDNTGEALIGVNVTVEGTTMGAITDLDGAYFIDVPEGTYNLEISYISYATQKIQGVVVNADETKVLPDIIMEEETQTLSEVVVQAKALENTDNALTTKQQNSENFIDGVSSKTIQKNGDANVAIAARRIPGVSIEGGKFIVVRGLGDRYSKSVLNGMDLPGLDPEKNAVQLDLFPTNILDNIIVYKTFTPNLPGDFVGGLVDINTKDFVDNKTIAINASYSYNTITHFKKDFILYDGYKADWFGFGKKQRELPFSNEVKLPNPNNLNITTDEKQQIYDYADALDKELAVKNKNNFLNQSYSFNYGDVKKFDKGSMFGYNFIFNYKANFDFTPNAQYAKTRVVASADDGYEYDIQEKQTGDIGSQNVIWNGFLSTSYKHKNNSITLYALHTQSAEKKATIRNVEDIFNVQNILSQNLEFFQKMITNVMLNGKHQISDKNNIDWSLSFTNSKFDDPNLSYTDLVLLNNDTLLQAGGTAGVNKVFRSLKEINLNPKVDYQYNFKQWNGVASKLKVGLANVFKQREFNTYTVIVKADPSTDPTLVDITGGANTILQNIWNPANDTGYYVSDILNNPSDQYKSQINTMAAYAMLTLPLHEKIKLITGLRVEYTRMQYSGTDRLTYKKINNQTVLNSVKPLPSVNFVFNLMKDFNLRASYNRTLARPSFKEKSQLVVYDPVLDQNFIGNLDLVETDINNVDLRLEYFFGKGDIVSITGFYKNFKNPIEVQSFSSAAPNDLTASNRDKANLYGIEFELRKSLDFINPKLSGLQLGANVTYIKSSIDRTADEQYKYTKFNESISHKREMQGQSPYLINAFVSYAHPTSGTELNLSYNVKGKSIAIVSIGDYPYIYEDPFHNLDFKITQKLGKKDQFNLSFKANNLLGDNRNLYYEFLNLGKTNYRTFEEGRTFQLGFSWSLAN